MLYTFGRISKKERFCYVFGEEAVEDDNYGRNYIKTVTSFNMIQLNRLNISLHHAQSRF